MTEQVKHTPKLLTIQFCEVDPLENVSDLCGNQFFKLKTDENDTVAIVFCKNDAVLYSASPALLSVCEELLGIIRFPGTAGSCDIGKICKKAESAINAAKPKGGE